MRHNFLIPLHLNTHTQTYEHRIFPQFNVCVFVFFWLVCVSSASCAFLLWGYGFGSSVAVCLQHSSILQLPHRSRQLQHKEQERLARDAHVSPVPIFFATDVTETECVQLMKSCNSKAPNLTRGNQKLRKSLHALPCFMLNNSSVTVLCCAVCVSSEVKIEHWSGHTARSDSAGQESRPALN